MGRSRKEVVGVVKLYTVNAVVRETGDETVALVDARLEINRKKAA